MTGEKLLAMQRMILLRHENCYAKFKKQKVSTPTSLLTADFRVAKTSNFVSITKFFRGTYPL